MQLLDPVNRFVAADRGGLIGGEWVPGSGGTIDVENPATGTILTSVANMTATDVDAAVDAARRALPVWRGLPPTERAQLMWRLGDLIAERADELAQLDALDNGKTVGDALAVDLPLTIEIFRYYAGWVTKIEGRQLPISIPDFHAYTRREPMGVVGAIVPWNFPLLMCAYKLGPALAAGNTVVLKPAEQTPLSALRLGELIIEAGFPPGVVNIITGDGPTTGAPLAAHTGVDKVSFTGDYQTGRKILDASQGNLKRVTLELGGKSPNIVFPDAQLEAAVDGAFGSVFFNQGQCCIAGSRLFAHEAIADELVERLVAKAEGIVLGSGLDDRTDMGPLVSAVQLDRVLGHVERARQDGATVLTGGERGEGTLAAGHFVRPTVVTDVDSSMPIMNDEVFGPVVAVSRFTDEADVVERANDIRFGLAAGIWTTDVRRTHRVAAALQAGTVWVNTYGMFDVAAPYGGYKMSGYGRELGEESLDAYLQSKTVWVNLA
ncbi:MAG: aldehyde dehydrogenase family protein [Ilumatobacteraceae bacterium]|uniref:aldehyde dehydrogenase family protein n=1 Tax=Ilumatobacter fluminis TaxID=467091 RepID=UPI00296A0DAF|nr:aldehyde dehydrogenase family protein [Ilumatobacteraceae bacterium]